MDNIAHEAVNFRADNDSSYLASSMSDTIDLTVNGQVQQVAENQTIADLLDHLELNPDQVAVEVNLDLVPRECHATHTLSAGDRVEVVTLVGGG